MDCPLNEDSSCGLENQWLQNFFAHDAKFDINKLKLPPYFQKKALTPKKMTLE